VKAFQYLCLFAALAAIFFAGCGAPHGRPRGDSEVLAPNEVLEFGPLFSENCSGCHGAEGRGGAAIALANPVYLALADDASIRKVIAQGVSGTAMPAFAQSAGGMLTDAQIDVITKEIRSRWSRRGILDAASIDWRRAAWQRRIPNFLRVLPRLGRSRWTKGKRHLRRFLSRTRQRSESAHHRNRRPP